MDTPQNVPTTDTDGHLKGYGTLPVSQGRGIQNGHPYGEQLETERHEVAMTYRFWPAAAARLRGATRKALGRG